MVAAAGKLQRIRGRIASGGAAFSPRLRADARGLLRFCLFHPCLILAAFLAGGILLFPGRSESGQDPEPGRMIAFRGWISAAPQQMEDSLFLQLSPLQAVQDGQEVRIPGFLSAYITSSGRTPEELFTPPLEYGDTLQFNALLREPSFYLTPGVEDFRRVAKLQGSPFRVYLKSPLQVTRHRTYPPASLLRPLFRYAGAFREFCRIRLPSSELSMILAAFLGERRALSREDQDRIRKLGAYHLFVVSGFHVSLFMLLGSRLAVGSPRLRPFLILTSLWAYVLMVGAQPSALRAGILCTLAYLLAHSGLPSRFLNCVGFSALVLLTVNPDLLRTPGFQFSSLCLLAIGFLDLQHRPFPKLLAGGLRAGFCDVVLTAPDANSRRCRWVRFWAEERLAGLPGTWAGPLLRAAARILEYSITLILVSLAIQYLTLPATLYYTNRWIWSQTLTNLFLIPVFTLLLPLWLLLFLTFWIPGADLLVFLVRHSGSALHALIRRLTGWTWISLVAQPAAPETALYFLLILAASRLRGPRRLGALLLPPLWLWVSLHRQPSSPDPQLVITLVDVGQGDAIHLLYPQGQEALIDTGGLVFPPGNRGFVGERVLSRYLWQRRTGGLEYVLITHPDRDHAQGYEFVREAFPVNRLFFHEPPESPIPGKGRQLSAGDSFWISGVRHSVLHPPRPDPPAGWTGNNASLVVRLTFGGFSMLLTGDIEGEVEQLLLPALGPVTVLKTAHHGARTSSSPRFLEAVRPRAALTSAGRDNPFGHPSRVTLDRFREARIPHFSTRRWGSLQVRTDGRTWRVLRYQPEEGRFRELFQGLPLAVPEPPARSPGEERNRAGRIPDPGPPVPESLRWPGG